jgi:hypothetical protein
MTDYHVYEIPSLDSREGEKHDEGKVRILRGLLDFSPCLIWLDSVPDVPRIRIRGDHGPLLGWLRYSPWARQHGRILRGVAEVTFYGAQKYEMGGWMRVPDAVQRYLEAFVRHSVGVQPLQLDESGLPHCFHAAWNLLAVLCLTRTEQGTAEYRPDFALVQLALHYFDEAEEALCANPNAAKE